MNNRPAKRLFVITSLLLPAGFLGTNVFGQCTTLSVSQPDEFRRNQSLSIRIHPFESSPGSRKLLSKLEPLEELPAQLTERLREKLSDSGYFSSIESEMAGRSRQAELRLDGFIMNLSPGSISVPFAGGVPSALEVMLSWRNSAGQEIAAFGCTGRTETGIVTSPKTWMNRSMDRLGSELAKAVLRAEKEIKAVPDRSLITATTENALVVRVPLFLTLRSPEQWAWLGEKAEQQLQTRGLKAPVAENASATSSVNRNGTIVAFWRTTANAMLLESTYRRFYAIAHRNQEPPPRAGNDRMSPDEFAKLLNDPDGLVLLVSYARKGSLTRWEIEKTKRATALRSSTLPGHEIRPVLVRNALSLPAVQDWRTGKPQDLWTWNSLVMVFPARDHHGQELLRNVINELELSTWLDEHEVMMKFDLNKMRLRGAEQLLGKRQVSGARTSFNAEARRAQSRRPL